MGVLQGQAIHVDRHLTNLAMNYRPQGFIADMIFPIVRVPNQSDMIKTYLKNDLYRIDNDIRAPGAEANQINFEVGSDNYYCRNYALKVPTTIEDRANADPIFVRDIEQGRVMFIQDKLHLGWENRISNQISVTANVSTVFVVASAWTDYTNSRPLEDVWTAMDEQTDQTAYRPNRHVAGEQAWRSFSRNYQVINKVNGAAVDGGAKNATKLQAAALLEADQMLVGAAFKSTAEEGITTALSQFWADKWLAYYAPARPSIEVPSYGYTFRWAARGIANMTVERHPFNTLKKSDEIEIGYYQDEKLTDKTLGTLIDGVNSSQ